MWMLLLALGDRCDLDPETLDYSQPEHWICRPGQDDLCSAPPPVLQVDLQGDVQEVEVPVADTGIDCFFVYPTMDMRLAVGLHKDATDLEDEQRITLWQAAHMGQVCEVWAPVYRQVTIGTYFRREKRAEPCLDSAYDDVLAAFEAYLAASDRPFILAGHSQGAHHITRLLDERIADDPALRERLVVAWPIGSPRPETEQFPLCSDSAEPGCVMAFRSYLDGNPLPELGSPSQCVNPAAPGSLDWQPLPDVLLPTVPERPTPAEVEPALTTLLRYPEGFSARCQSDDEGHAGLQVRWDGPPDQDPLRGVEGLDSVVAGAHILDFAFGLYPLMDDLKRRRLP
ncbi:MAG: DUF3089 domain-containing protein [Myxococcota bacterium]|nr:DUF3089 domain-containing protein [Myxococcota bacterium]